MSRQYEIAPEQACKKALAGCRIVLTRPEKRNAKTKALLQSLGAIVSILPLTEQIPLPDYKPNALLAAGKPETILILTSPTAAQFFFESMPLLGQGLRIASVGTATSSVIQSYGYSVALSPPLATAESLAEMLIAYAAQCSNPLRCIHPCSEIALPTLGLRLRAANITYLPETRYKTIAINYPKELLAQSIAPHSDAILLYSPSAAEALITQAKQHRLEKQLHKSLLVAIGQTTAAPLLAASYPVLCAENPSDQSLIELLTSKSL